MIIADTNVLSEPLRAVPDVTVMSWLTKHEAVLVTTAITVGELRYGALRLPAGKRRVQLLAAIDKLTAAPGNNVLPYDNIAAQIYANLRAEQEQLGRILSDADLMIASIALAHQSPIATRNTRHFLDLGLQVINPWFPS